MRPAANHSASSPLLFWKLQLAGWSAYAIALTVPWLGYYTLSSMLPNKVAVAATGLATSSLLRWPYRALVRRGAGVATLSAAAVVASLLGALAWNAAASALVGTSLQHDALVLGALGTTLPRFDGVLYHTLVLLTWSLLYLGAGHYRDLVAERERSLRAEGLAREARLLALRYQIGPHFLFNALNAISTLVVTDRRTEAAAMIAKLADLLRLSLETPAGTMIPLRTEAEIARRYLEVEQVRFGDRLRVDFDVAAEAMEAPVPAMILQPLVENAVRHAVAVREEPTLVRVRAELRGPTLHLAVCDDGPGLRPAADRAEDGEEAVGFGLGLANTRARLDEAYVGAHRFELRTPPTGGLCVELDLPAPAPAAVATRGMHAPALPLEPVKP